MVENKKCPKCGQMILVENPDIKPMSLVEQFNEAVDREKLKQEVERMILEDRELKMSDQENDHLIFLLKKYSQVMNLGEVDEKKAWLAAYGMKIIMHLTNEKRK